MRTSLRLLAVAVFLALSAGAAKAQLPPAVEVDLCVEAPRIEAGDTITAPCTGFLVPDERVDELLAAEKTVESAVAGKEAAEERADKAEKKQRRAGKGRAFLGGASVALVVVVIVLVAL